MAGTIGISQYEPNGCLNPDLIGDSTQLTVNGTVFNPSYPANCPYVLSVGATQLNDNDTIRDAESAMNLPVPRDELAALNISINPDISFSSSGVFSNNFARPHYQKNAVDTRFAQHDPGYPYCEFNGIGGLENGTNIGADGGLYNRNGRAMPDVSANGANFMFYEFGVLSPEHGTSLAAPIWASILTLINGQRTAAVKGPSSFFNPVLYQNPQVFNDITNGTNPGCGTDGFRAVEGWDPITCLGTPSYPKLLELLMGLP